MNGEGEELTERSLAVAERLLNLSPDLRTVVGIFPTLEGGVQLEDDAFEVLVHPDGSVHVTDDLLEGSEQHFAYEAFTGAI